VHLNAKKTRHSLPNVNIRVLEMEVFTETSAAFLMKHIFHRAQNAAGMGRTQSRENLKIKAPAGLAFKLLER
jgi:hypothetical protein